MQASGLSAIIFRVSDDQGRRLPAVRVFPNAQRPPKTIRIT